MYLPDDKKLLEIAIENGTPTYTYDLNKVASQYKKLETGITWENKRIHYAVKANWHPEILRTLRELGSGIECVSRGEVEHALDNKFKPEDIIFTGSGQLADDLIWIAKQGIQINVDSLYQLEVLGESGVVEKISLRLNNDIGEGHHSHVVTGGSKSKFGIHQSDVKKAIAIANQHNLVINGLHQHIGSHILEEHMFIAAMEAIYDQAVQFPDLEFIDFGGSFGTPYHPGVDELDMKKLGALMSNSFADFCNRYGCELKLVIEPGRYLVAEAGTLLVKVVDIKNQPARTFVLVNSGLNHLIRPALYDSYHHITNLSNPDGELSNVAIGGNICESGDLFALDRELASASIGDILAIHTAGAYGYSMSSRYNLHDLPKEICYEF